MEVSECEKADNNSTQSDGGDSLPVYILQNDDTLF